MEVTYKQRNTEKKGATTTMSPAEYVQNITPPELAAAPSPSTASFDKTDRSAGYTMEVVGAIRANDIAALQYMLDNGTCFDVCNTNGEYLIHLACRRAQPETVEFLLTQAGVRPDVRDTFGRTIFHDICWKSTPDFDMMSTVLRVTGRADLLLTKDIRGHQPFDFARKHHWNQWMEFLVQNQDLFQQAQ